MGIETNLNLNERSKKNLINQPIFLDQKDILDNVKYKGGHNKTRFSTSFLLWGGRKEKERSEEDQKGIAKKTKGII